MKPPKKKKKLGTNFKPITLQNLKKCPLLRNNVRISPIINIPKSFHNYSTK